MYNVNFKKFARSLLPFSMRGDDTSSAKLIHLLDVLTHPFRVLHHRFMEFRSRSLWKLSYNACVGSMQAMLNDRFADDVALRASGNPILVEDGEQVQELVLNPKLDETPMVLGITEVTSHTAWGAVPFVVKIPSELAGDNKILNAIERLVKLHKFAGTKYSTTYYQNNNG